MKIQRNSDCPCGSRRKYKKCCENRPSWGGSREGLQEEIDLLDATLEKALNVLCEEEYAEFQDFALNSLALFLDLDESTMALFMDSPLGSQICLEYLMFLAPDHEQNTYVVHQGLSSSESVAVRDFARSRISLFEILNAREDILEVRDILSEEIHFLPVLSPAEFAQGEWVSGRVVQTEHGKLLLSSYAAFQPTEARLAMIQGLRERVDEDAESQILVLSAMELMARSRNYELRDS